MSNSQGRKERVEEAEKENTPNSVTILGAIFYTTTIVIIQMASASILLNIEIGNKMGGIRMNFSLFLANLVIIGLTAAFGYLINLLTCSVPFYKHVFNFVVLLIISTLYFFRFLYPGRTLDMNLLDQSTLETKSVTLS